MHDSQAKYQVLNMFYRQESVREIVHDFLIESLRKNAADAALQGHSTAGIKEGKDAIDRAFQDMKEWFGADPESRVENEAR